MKWSTLLVTALIGTRAASLQLKTSVDFENTNSLDYQPLRKQHSSHSTYTVPSPAISAVGSGLVRRLPTTPWKRIPETLNPRLQEAPPLSEWNAEMVPFRLSNGT